MTQEQRENIRANIEKIRAALAASAKNPDIVLLAATKTRTPEEINFAIECGITHIGENRVQELLEKYDAIDTHRVSVHFIGHLQTNKVRHIIDKVDMIHSVDSYSLAQEISKRALAKGKKMDILVEINLAGEESKSGIRPEETLDFVQKISVLEGISVKGLMAIPPICTDPDKQIKFFQKIFGIFIDISTKNIDNSTMQVLSIGMSDDYTLAAAAGSTMVRVGSGIFGARVYPTPAATVSEK